MEGNTRSSSRNAKNSAGSFRSDSLPVRKDSRTIVITREEAMKAAPGRTDFAYFATLTDEDIVRSVANDPDAAPVDIDWSKGVMVYPAGKIPLSIRIDPDVLAFFKSAGRGYQTRINAVLRSYMEHEKNKE